MDGRTEDLATSSGRKGYRNEINIGINLLRYHIYAGSFTPRWILNPKQIQFLAHHMWNSSTASINLHSAQLTINTHCCHLLWVINQLEAQKWNSFEELIVVVDIISCIHLFNDSHLFLEPKTCINQNTAY